MSFLWASMVLLSVSQLIATGSELRGQAFEADKEGSVFQAQQQDKEDAGEQPRGRRWGRREACN